MNLKRANIYIKQAQMMFEDVLIYRADFITRFISWGTRFFISAYLWIAIVNSKNGEIAGYNLQESLTYFLLIQIVSGFVFSSAGFQTSSDIQSGELSNKLILPADYLLMLFSREFGRNIFFLISNIIIYGILGIIFQNYFDLDFYFSMISLAIISTMMAFILNFSMNVILGLFAFWISTAGRLIYTFFGIITLVSGIIVPIDFFPQNIQTLLKFSPFPYMFFYPVHILQSHTINLEIIYGLTLQLLFTCLLTAIMYAVYYKGLKTYEAVGR